VTCDFTWRGLQHAAAQLLSSLLASPPYSPLDSLKVKQIINRAETWSMKACLTCMNLSGGRIRVKLITPSSGPPFAIRDNENARAFQPAFSPFSLPAMDAPISASEYFREIFSTSPSLVPRALKRFPPGCRDERAKHVPPARSQLLPVRASLKRIHGEFINVAVLSIQNPTRLAGSCRRPPVFATGSRFRYAFRADSRAHACHEPRNKPRSGSFLLLS